jgi:hypothetical protein
MVQPRPYCTHCWRPQRGRAQVWVDGSPYPLCHSSTDMDCYRLVTIYGHPVYACSCWMRTPADDLITDENL